MSLYNNSASKEDLILAIFDAYIDHTRIDYEGGFRGCRLLNVAAEFPAGSFGRARVGEQIQRLIQNQLEDSGHRSLIQLAIQLVLLREGGMSRPGVEHSTALLFQARNIATSLLEAQ